MDMEVKDNETLDLRTLFIQYLLHWKLILGTGIFSLIIAVLYLALYPKTYEATAQILLQDDKDSFSSNSIGLGEAAGLMKSFGISSAASSAVNLEDELDNILSDVNKKVAKAMIENTIMTKVFNKELSNQIVDALANGDVALANQLFGKGMDAIYDLAPELRAFAESAGLLGDDLESSSSSTQGTALSSVSQESFDMYSGRAANIQTHVISIDKGVLSMAANSTTMVNILNDISGDTARLEVISADIASMRTALSEIVMDGLKVR